MCTHTVSNAGVIAGAVIGSMLAVAAVVCIAVFLYCFMCTGSRRNERFTPLPGSSPKYDSI